jgi:RND family efflux transporter MFP subunit
MRRSLRLLLITLMSGAALLGWRLWKERPLPVRVAAAIRCPAVEAVYATGTVEPVRWAAVAPALKGRLREILVDDGDRVVAGQLLARLDDTVARAQVAEAEARARFAAEEAERLEWLIERSATARRDADRARSEARALEAAAEAQRRRLGDYDLRAPIDGVVLRRDGEPGEMVDTSDTVFWIGETAPLRVTAEVDEEDMPRVAVGQKVLLRADAFPDQVIEGRLTAITPKGDPVQKTYRVRISLPSDSPLLIGMTVEANIVVREEPAAVLVPSLALRDGALYVLEGDHAAWRQVELGVVGPELAEVRGHLAEGELVIVDPPPRLKAGQRLRALPGGDVATAVAAPTR